jgi:hypothetical protein
MGKPQNTIPDWMTWSRNTVTEDNWFDTRKEPVPGASALVLEVADHFADDIDERCGNTCQV